MKGIQINKVQNDLISDQGNLNSIQVGSNGTPFTEWKHEERNRHKDRQMYLIKLQWVA